jgi:HEAT repeat protein
MDHTLRDLMEALRGEDGMGRKRARETMVLIGDEIAPRMRTLLAEGTKRERWEAAKTLAALVDPSSLDTFIQLLSERESDIRWIAADGLIALGPRVVVPLLKSLLAEPPTRGQAEMSGRVLRKLASENDVLANILAPVLEVMESPDPGVLQPRVSQALSDLDRVTGRLPEL